MFAIPIFSRMTLGAEVEESLYNKKAPHLGHEVRGRRRLGDAMKLRRTFVDVLGTEDQAFVLPGENSEDCPEHEGRDHLVLHRNCQPPGCGPGAGEDCRQDCPPEPELFFALEGALAQTDPESNHRYDCYQPKQRIRAVDPTVGKRLRSHGHCPETGNLFVSARQDNEAETSEEYSQPDAGQGVRTCHNTASGCQAEADRDDDQELVNFHSRTSHCSGILAMILAFYVVFVNKKSPSLFSGGGLYWHKATGLWGRR